MMSGGTNLWDISPSGRVDGTAHSSEALGGTENGLWVIWTSDRRTADTLRFGAR